MEPLNFTTLYELYAPDVMRFARYLTGNPDWAGEILSETFLRAWTTPESLLMASAKGYLIAIARNLITDQFRKQRHEAPLDFDSSSPDENPETKRVLDQTLLDQKNDCHPESQ